MEQRKCEDCRNKKICMYQEDFKALISELKTNDINHIFTIHCKYFGTEINQFR